MHTEAEIAWVLANRELVMQWLEERGGWQDGDQGVGILTTKNEGTIGTVHHHRTVDTEGYYQTGWAVSEEFCGHLHWYCNKEIRISEDWIWLPAIGDVVVLLWAVGKKEIVIGEGGIMLGEPSGWYAYAGDDGVYNQQTGLIALMELLKAAGNAV